MNTYPGITVHGCDQESFQAMITSALNEIYDIEATNQAVTTFISILLSLKAFGKNGYMFLPFEFNPRSPHRPLAINGIRYTQFARHVADSLRFFKIDTKRNPELFSAFLSHLGRCDANRLQPIQCYSNIKKDAAEQRLLDALTPFDFLQPAQPFNEDLNHYEFSIVDGLETLLVQLHFEVCDFPTAKINIIHCSEHNLVRRSTL